MINYFTHEKLYTILQKYSKIKFTKSHVKSINTKQIFVK